MSQTARKILGLVVGVIVTILVYQLILYIFD